MRLNSLFHLHLQSLLAVFSSTHA